LSEIQKSEMSGQIIELLTEADAERAAAYAEQARAANTRRAYDSDWRHFSDWSRSRGIEPMPASASLVATYLALHAGELKVSTLQRRLTAIKIAHELAGFELDTTGRTFRDIWSGIKKEHGAPASQKAALMITDLRKLVDGLPETLIGLRDRALLLIGFAGALRRSELVSLCLQERIGDSWIEKTRGGLVLHLGRTKADQQASGEDVGVPYGSNPYTCPVRAFDAWTNAAELTEGPLFRAIDRHGNVGIEALSDKTVVNVVKAAVKRVAITDGMSQEKADGEAARFAGHSLRSGLATSAAEAGVAGHLIQRQCRHKRFDTTTRYIRKGELFRQNAAGMVGL